MNIYRSILSKSLASVMALTLLLLCAGSVQATLLMNESFSYPDGPISTSSGGLWVIHSGTDAGATALNIASGQAQINQNDTTGGRADANRLFDGGVTFDPSSDNTTKLYASFKVTATALPIPGDGDGSYFAHFKSSAANEFYGRIGANLNGAASGAYRLAVANEIWNVAASIEYPLDLSLNTTYTVVARLDLATDKTTLWINPVDENSTSITATDLISYAAGAINAYALRQGTSGTGAPGDFNIDDLRVATSFAEVVPEPASVGIFAIGLLLCFCRRK